MYPRKTRKKSLLQKGNDISWQSSNQALPSEGVKADLFAAEARRVLHGFGTQLLQLLTGCHWDPVSRLCALLFWFLHPTSWKKRKKTCYSLLLQPLPLAQLSFWRKLKVKANKFFFNIYTWPALLSPSWTGKIPGVITSYYAPRLFTCVWNCRLYQGFWRKNELLRKPNPSHACFL